MPCSPKTRVTKILGRQPSCGFSSGFWGGRECTVMIMTPQHTVLSIEPFNKSGQPSCFRGEAACFISGTTGFRGLGVSSDRRCELGASAFVKWSCAELTYRRRIKHMTGSHSAHVDAPSCTHLGAYKTSLALRMYACTYVCNYVYM